MAYHGRMDAEPTRPAPRLAWWLATGLGSGYLRPAPGTWGTLAGLLAWVALVRGLGALGASWTPWALLAAPLALTLVDVSVAFAMGSLSFVAVAVLSRLLLGERISLLRGGGLLLILGGVALMGGEA